MKYLYKDYIWTHRSKDDFRWWLYWGNTIWRYEGYLGKKANHTCIGFDLGGDENDFTFSLGIKGLFTFFFGVESFFPRKIMRKLFDDTRNYGVSLFDGYISIEFHRDDNGYSEGWRGFHRMIDLKEVFRKKNK